MLITRASFRTYYYLAKPGIVYGNLLPAVGAYLLAAHWQPHVLPGLALIGGLGGVMGGACVFNNIIDQPLDALMERTKRRALPSGQVRLAPAIIYGGLLLAAGLAVLAAYTTKMSVLAAGVGAVAYVAVYGYAKRKTPYGTIIGSLAGAIPPVVGYTAAAGRLDAVALSLFIIMALWQVPHFYAIAMVRLPDYQAAGLPVWPVRYGLGQTRGQIIGWIMAFTAMVWLPVWLGVCGFVYAGAMMLLCLVWLWRALQPVPANGGAAWARRVFGWSLVVLLGWSALIALPGV